MKSLNFSVRVMRVLFSVLMCTLILAVAGFGGWALPASIALHGVVFVAGYFDAFPAGSLFENVIDSTAVVKFAKDAETKFRPNNEFYLKSVDDTPLVNDSGDMVVHAVAGDDPETVENPTSFPLEVQNIEDDVVSYGLDLIATKPQRISDLKKAITNYPFRQTIIDSHNNSLMVKVANKMIEKWSPAEADRYLRSTGTAVPAALTGKGATGNRKGFLVNDIIDAAAVLIDDDIDTTELYGLITPKIWAQLMKQADVISYEKTGRSDKLAKGLIGSIANIEFFVRSVAARYTNDGTPVPLGSNATTVSTTNSGILIWTPSCVRRAEGVMDVYLNPKQGTMLGDTYNVSKRYGGRRRKDKKGVVALIEDAA